MWRLIALAVTAGTGLGYLALMRLAPGTQSYRRVSATGYEYEAPDAGYRGTLEFSGRGIIVDYPELVTLVGGA